MRLNRKWLYLGGLVTILTLLLTLTLVLPAGAVGQLDDGSLSTDVDYVSPKLADAADRTVEVILTNSDLNITETVEEDGDFGPITLSVNGAGDDVTGAFTPGTGADVDDYSVVGDGPTITVDLGNKASSGHFIYVDLGGSSNVDNTDDGSTAADDALPITGSLVVDYGPAGESDVTADQVGQPIIKNRAQGLIELPINANLDGGDKIVLVYTTSPQETALANIAGDSDDFDVVAIEDESGPVGDYSATFVTAEEVTINLTGGIDHEQHPVPGGLRGWIEQDDEEITKFYSSAAGALTADSALILPIPETGLPADTNLWVRVAKSPIRSDLTDAAFSIDNQALRLSATLADHNATTGVLQLVVKTGSTFNDDEIEVTYIGSDSFYIEVEHGPIQTAVGSLALVVPQVDSDDTTASTDKLQVIDISDGENDPCKMCRVRIGVMAGDSDTDEDDGEALNPRISVLGISYNGSERTQVDDRLPAASTFTMTLDFEPADANSNDSLTDDINVVAVGGNLTGITAVTPTDVDGRVVTFTLGATPFSSGTLTSEVTIDVAYTAKVGADPRNALVPAATDRPIIGVSAGSRVTITSGDDRLTVDAEVDPPQFANPIPAHNGATGRDDELISLEITDELAGVDQDSIVLTVTVKGADYVVDNDDLSFEDIGGGVRMTIALDDVESEGGASLAVDSNETTTITWSVTADDNAGNQASSDAVANVASDPSTDGEQEYSFTVDGEDASMDRAFTGDWFNTEEERVEGDRRLGQNLYQPGSADNTSIRVVFNEAIDGSSVDASDFTVDGAEALDAQWFGEGETGDDDDPIENSVFLTVRAIDADATPVVALLGSVLDKAGNGADSGSETAFDGIAPSPVVTVDQALSDEKVTVTVRTDERIRTLSPTLELYVRNALDAGSQLDESDTFTVELEEPDDATSQLVLRDGEGNSFGTAGNLNYGEKLVLTLNKAPILDRNNSGEVDRNDITLVANDLVALSSVATDFDGDGGKVTVMVVKWPDLNDNGNLEENEKQSLALGDSFTISYDGTDADPAKGLAGVPNPSGRQVSSTSWTFDLSVTRNDSFAVTATVEDGNRNRAIGGQADPEANGATVFEIDNRLAGGQPATTDPLHDAPGNNPVSTSPRFFIELNWDDEKGEYPGDSSNGVTLTKAELDGEDVLANAVSQDANSFRISINDIALGDHELRYNAEDALGNTNATDRVLKFTVQPVPTWDLNLSAGMNLVSLPSNPAERNVNVVFGDTPQIDLIYTFEGGQSKVALRNADNPSEFVGTLNTIDAQHAYWISVDNAATVEISIPPTSQIAPPPYIAVKGGQWNLVPVISLGAVDDDTAGLGASPGTKIDPDAYLGDFRTAFGWGGRSWIKVDPDGENVTDRLTNDIADGAGDDMALKVGLGYWVLYNEDAIITP